MKRLTVLQLLPDLNVGGVERGTIEIAASLVAHGHRALVASNHGRLVAELAESGGEHINLPVGKKSLFSRLHLMFQAASKSSGGKNIKRMSSGERFTSRTSATAKPKPTTSKSSV